MISLLLLLLPPPLPGGTATAAAVTGGGGGTQQADDTGQPGGAAAAAAVLTSPCSVGAVPNANLSDVQAIVRRLVASLNHTECPEVRVALDGLHALRAAMTFTTADSGTSETPVVWTTSAGSQATISGGRTITGWTRRGTGPIWSAQLPDDVDTPHQLFVAGVRQVRARSPDAGRFFTIESVVGNNTASSSLILGGGSAPSVESTEGVEAVVFASYFAQRYSVGSLRNTSNGGGISLSFPEPILPPKYPIYKAKRGVNHSRAYLENAPEFLDAPGEWVVNVASGTETRTLLYYPPPDIELNDTVAVVSVAPELLQIRGASHLRFEGLRLMHTDHWSDVFPLPHSMGGTTDQAGYLLNSAAVHIIGSDSHDIELVGCTVAHTAGYGVWVHGGASRVQIHSSALYDLGAGGVRFGDGGAGGPALKPGSWGLVLNDSRVEDGGHVTHGAAGVFVHTNAYNSVVSHNLVRRFEWSGISVGQVSSFSNSADPASYNPARCSDGNVSWPTNYSSVVAYNEVADIATGPARLSDNGGIYSPAINTRFVGNYIHGVSCFTFGGRACQ